MGHQPSRSIETIIGPVDRFARTADGRPLKADPVAGIIRVLGTAEQQELAPFASDSELYWLIPPRQAQDSIDFQLFRDVLRTRNLVAMGVVSAARRGVGAVLVVPTLDGFVLQAVDRTSPTGPFDRLFSVRAMTTLVADWAEQIVHSRSLCAAIPVNASGHTGIWGSPVLPLPTFAQRKYKEAST